MEVHPSLAAKEKSMVNGGYETMSNGELLKEVLEILTQEKDIPELSPTAAARISIAAQVQMFGLYNSMRGDVTANRKLIDGLVQDKQKRDERAKEIRGLYYRLYIGIILIVVDIIIHGAPLLLSHIGGK